MVSVLETLASSDHVADLRASATRAPPSRLDAVLDAVVARLTDELSPRVHVERFPADPDRFDFTGRDAAVLVICSEGSFARAGSPATSALVETLTLVCSILVRSLDGAHGAPALIEDVRLALQGRSLAGSSAMQPLGFRLIDQSEGAFQFDFTFETRLPAVSGSDHPAMRDAP